jgi:hypothetical protein
MREKLNSNPLAQAGLVGALLLVAAVFVMSSKGGAAEESAPAPSSAEVAPAEAPEGGLTALPAPGSGPGSPPAIPSRLTAAFKQNDTVVVLFVHSGGIDDRMVAADLRALSSMPGVADFVVPADRIARYATIAQGVDLNRVPALVVFRPQHLDHGVPAASVDYGYQSPESIEQAILDAGYKGRTVPYHP